MEPSFASIEKDLSVSRDPRRGRQRRTTTRSVAAPSRSDGRARVLRHNRIGCQKSGFCELGCAYDAKQNALKVVVPQALAAGADLYSDVDVAPHPRRARKRPSASRRSPTTASARRSVLSRSSLVRAKVVVLAGSAVGSAALARRSGLPDPLRAARSRPPHASRRRRRGPLRRGHPRAPRHPSVVRVHRAALLRGGERQARLDRPRVRPPDRHRRDAARLRRRAHARRCAPTATSRS